jgi:hypothetical protein
MGPPEGVSRLSAGVLRQEPERQQALVSDVGEERRPRVRQHRESPQLACAKKEPTLRESYRKGCRGSCQSVALLTGAPATPYVVVDCQALLGRDGFRPCQPGDSATIFGFACDLVTGAISVSDGDPKAGRWIQLALPGYRHR